MSRPILAAALCVLLCACTTVRPDKVTVQTVNVPIPVPCSASPGVKPDLADPKAFADAVAAAPDIFAVSGVYAATVQQLFNWSARLEAADSACLGK